MPFNLRANADTTLLLIGFRSPDHPTTGSPDCPATSRPSAASGSQAQQLLIASSVPASAGGRNVPISALALLRKPFQKVSGHIHKLAAFINVFGHAPPYLFKFFRMGRGQRCQSNSRYCHSCWAAAGDEQYGACRK